MGSSVVETGALGEAGQLISLTVNQWVLKTGPHTPGF